MCKSDNTVESTEEEKNVLRGRREKNWLCRMVGRVGPLKEWVQRHLMHAWHLQRA